ncbi:AI-2E family transporter [Methylocystis parvus]|uniref:AI-2E family transporter n=1 Tax=Methylocystis parvus TaxID=134 RepID=UPI003C76FFE0
MNKGRGAETACIIIAFLIVLAVCKVAQTVIEPAAFAIFIITIVLPVKNALRPRIGNGAAISITLVATALVLLALLSVIAWEAREIVDWVNRNIDRIQDSLVASTSWLEAHDIFVLTMITDQFDPATIVRILQVAAMKVNTLLAFALIVMIYVVLGLNEAGVIRGRIAALKNEEASSHLLAASEQIGHKFRTYIVVRTGASIATGLSVWLLARLIGLEMAGACGMLAFSLNYLPYIGSFIVTVLLPLFALVHFGSMESAALVLVGMLFIQAVIGSYLEPVFSGEALSISPPLVLFSIVLWTFLWGALGAFLGVPIAIAFITLLAEFPSTRSIADILSGGRIEAKAYEIQRH